MIKHSSPSWLFKSSLPPPSDEDSVILSGGPIPPLHLSFSLLSPPQSAAAPEPRVLSDFAFVDARNFILFFSSSSTDSCFLFLPVLFFPPPQRERTLGRENRHSQVRQPPYFFHFRLKGHFGPFTLRSLPMLVEPFSGKVPDIPLFRILIAEDNAVDLLSRNCFENNFW